MSPQKRSRKPRQVWVRIGTLLPEAVTATASSRYLSFISDGSLIGRLEELTEL